MGFEWSLHSQNLIASFNRNSNVVKFWDVNSYQSEESRKVILQTHNEAFLSGDGRDAMTIEY